MIKKCTCCGETKPLAEYQKRAMSKDGVTASCKSCLSKRDANRFKNDPRVKDRHRVYQSTEAGKESANRSRKKWLGENPEKRAAHVILGNRIRDGKITKPESCEKCGASGRIEGHHHDYSKPLDVTWLCRMCHVAQHHQPHGATS